MTFNSLLFLAFFAIVFTVVCLLRRQVLWRNLFLLIAGWTFYAAWDWRFLFLLIGTSSFDYVVARLIHSSDPARHLRRKALVAASITCNLTVLGFFKYFNFFVDSLVQLGDFTGIHIGRPTLQVVLPVGISFYTFQSIAYVIDVYRGHLRAERNFIHYATFVGFFPQLVAGPIERATHLLPQIKAPNTITWTNVSHGFALASFGMFKKVVLADNIAHVANAVFNPMDVVPTWWESWIGIYAFALQIYCDFSAYSDIARGVARMMGFDLMRNFDLPYFAVNPSDFWRRWHISLSTWLRDYLYIPLGGNRGGMLVKPVRGLEHWWGRRRSQDRDTSPSKAGVHLSNYLNLFITMLLGGLWHGATWMFVLWGAYHGLLLCLHRLAQPWLKKYLTFRNRWAAGAWTAVRIVVFFQFTCIGWLLFRAVTLENFLRVVRPFYHFDAEHVAPLVTPRMVATLVVISLVLFVAQFTKYWKNDHEAIFRVPIPLRAAVYAGMILAILLFGEFGGGDFIYFQF